MSVSLALSREARNWDVHCALPQKARLEALTRSVLYKNSYLGVDPLPVCRSAIVISTFLWNSIENIMEFYGNPWNLMEFHPLANFPSEAVMEFHGISTKIPCISTECMENTMESWTVVAVVAAVVAAVVVAAVVVAAVIVVVVVGGGVVDAVLIKVVVLQK
ncbi:hypothetical protein DPMN_019989 [Dreissena polymorpha]|uniref:Uncharacterized protein n=1 Tax=Dreissena polymorpha TaxID=45954 RepID=A0A9D4NFZ5_DREPO|nr:hypothetical protein DPMN_019989 [Dreissena polymorpha]